MHSVIYAWPLAYSTMKSQYDLNMFSLLLEPKLEPITDGERAHIPFTAFSCFRTILEFIL